MKPKGLICRIYGLLAEYTPGFYLNQDSMVRVQEKKSGSAILPSKRKVNGILLKFLFRLTLCCNMYLAKMIHSTMILYYVERECLQMNANPFLVQPVFKNRLPSLCIW